MSMSRLWHKQGRRAGARSLLASAYDGFTEGFDTPDLVDARRLLGRLRLSLQKMPSQAKPGVDRGVERNKQGPD